MSTATAPNPPTVPNLEPDTVELHVRNVPRAVWLKARNAALASRLRFGRYVIKLLENAGPLPLTPPLHPTGIFCESPSPTEAASNSPDRPRR
jgi:hypothetical protein